MSDAEPLVIAADPHQTDAALVDAAIGALTRGELVVLPTDTVYGLACRADDDSAVQRLFAAKRRPLTKPLPLLLENAEALAQLSSRIEERALRLARRFWPGPLTMVVRKSSAVSDLVTAGQPTVGVRVPDLPLTQAILENAPFAVAVTSANFSDENPACSVSDLPHELLRQVALVIDAGPCPGMTPSTVVDVTSTPPQVVRRGPISEDQIRAALAASD